MKVSIAWLNTHLDRPVTADEAADVLTAVGFPIESRTDLPGGDVLIDAEVTSNRGDVLSHVGVAREVAAATGRTLLAPPDPDPPTTAAPVADAATLAVREPALCPLYTAHVLRGVTVGASPAWLRDRLAALGLRSVNNVVDATNFVLHELGQPLHAFDLAKLAGAGIVVRRAAKGEPFTALDGSRHTLTADMLVIADAQRPVALAGVMGGLDSEVTAHTTDILLESAVFAPLSVRTTSRALKLASDSSYRFERGVDPLGVARAARRAARLILDTAGGQLLQGVLRAGAPDPQPHRVTLRLDRLNQLLGRTVAPQRVLDLLAALQLSPTRTGATVACLVPSFRLDLQREVDLIEEVARLDGFDQIAVAEKLALRVRPVQGHVAARRRLGDVLVAHGFHETITFSFVRPAHGQPFVAPGQRPVLIDDARRQAEPMLRPSVLPSLLACRKTNQDAGNAAVQLFETASTWASPADAAPGDLSETRRLALYADAADGIDAAARGLRTAVEELIEALLGAPVTIAPVAPTAAFSDAAAVAVDGRVLGVLGRVAPAVLKAFDLQTPAVAAELELDPLLERYPPPRKVAEPARLPAIERDLSVIVAETVAWEKIERVVHAVAPALLEAIGFVVTYRGKPVPPGRKSVTLRLRFRDPQRTLRHGEVDPQVAAVVAALQRELDAELRT